MRIKAWHSQYATLKKWIKSETINNGNLQKKTNVESDTGYYQ